MPSWHRRVSLQNSAPAICQRCRRNATQLLLHATITIHFPEQHEINSDTTHQAPPSHGQTNRSNLRRLVSGSKTCCRHKTSLPQHPTCIIVFCWTRSLACVQQLFSRKTMYARCERYSANLPFVQTCNRPYLCGASRSVKPMDKEIRIPSAVIKSTGTT